MHSLLHDILRFLILFLEELFLIFNQMLSIRAFGRRDLGIGSIYQSWIFSLFPIVRCVVGSQKNSFSEMVHLSTHKVYVFSKYET